MIDVAAQRSRRAVAVHTGTHQLIVFVVGRIIRPAVRNRQVFTMQIVVKHIHQPVDLADGIAVTGCTYRLADCRHVHVAVAGADIDVFFRFPVQRPASIRDTGAGWHEDGAGLRFADGHSHGGAGWGGPGSLLYRIQFTQAVQILPLRPAGDVLVADVVCLDPLLDDHCRRPVDKQTLRVSRVNRAARDPLIPFNQEAQQFIGGGADKLVFRVTTHGYSPPQWG